MNMLSLKRPIPDSRILDRREKLLQNLRRICIPNLEQENPEGLSLGNTKTGRTGSKYKTVFVWNIPAVTTCPGASKICLRYCYNGDERKDIFPVEAWSVNLAWFEQKPDVLMQKINSQLLQATAPCAVRIHSSGDFFSSEYTRFWFKIALANPSIAFWAYTRSWCKTELCQELERLRGLENFELFASWDATMIAPPINWRLSMVTDNLRAWDDGELTAKKLFLCPEQVNLVANCASCGLCIKRDLKGVLFTLH